MDRRKFLTAAGSAVATGGLARPASAQSTLTIRKQAEISYKPDVLVVGGGPAGIGAALGAAASGANTLLIEHQLWCNVDYLKVAILDALDEVGCKYLVHTRAIDAVVEGDRITGVVVATKRGPAAMSAKKRCLPRELKVGQLQDALRADGVDLDWGGGNQDDLVNKG